MQDEMSPSVLHQRPFLYVRLSSSWKIFHNTVTTVAQRILLCYYTEYKL